MRWANKGVPRDRRVPQDPLARRTGEGWGEGATGFRFWGQQRWNALVTLTLALSRSERRGCDAEWRRFMDRMPVDAEPVAFLDGRAGQNQRGLPGLGA